MVEMCFFSEYCVSAWKRVVSVLERQGKTRAIVHAVSAMLPCRKHVGLVVDGPPGRRRPLGMHQYLIDYYLQ